MMLVRRILECGRDRSLCNELLKMSARVKE